MATAAFASLHAACAAATDGGALAREVEALLAQDHDVNGLDKEGRAPLHVAVRSDKLEIARVLLEKGADVNAKLPRGFTALHFAARHARPEVVELLLAKGVDVNATMEHGLSAAHIAAEASRVEVLELLVANGGDLEAPMRRGVSALHLAARGGHIHVAQYLLGKGIDINLATTTGVTALHDAAGRDDVAILTYLLEQGADYTAVDEQGLSALHRSIWGWKKRCAKAYAMVRVLVSHGATWDECCERELNSRLNRHRETGDDDSTLHKTLRWQAGFRPCVQHWGKELAAGSKQLTEIPVEVVLRGEESVSTYLADLNDSRADELVLRRKVCVVGPSLWGKTSLVKSLTSLVPTLVAQADRTIGIDLFAHEFVKEDGDTGVKKRYEITFWDFAGQDEYQAAHAMFFSKRTLYILCVDMKKYSTALREAEAAGTAREAEHAMTRFLRANVFRWVRAVISRQADAEFLVVGTKIDMIASEQEAEAQWRDLSDRLNDWMRSFVNEIDQELAASLTSEETEDNSHIQSLRASLARLFANDWLKVTSSDAESIQNAVHDLEHRIAASGRSFVMPITYTRVLEAIRARQAAAARLPSVDRIASSIVPVRALCKELMQEIDGLDVDECRAILETLHDLGDLLWYQHEASGVFKDTIVIDPTLVLDFVREVITHDHTARLASLSFIEEGRLTNAFLQTLPMWKDLDEELLFAFKQLLQFFQLAYPADNAEMDWDLDLIVPTYWKVYQPSHMKLRLAQQASMVQRHGISRNASQFCWEYELSAEVSETVFEHFAVQSYSSLLKRRVHSNSIEAFVQGDCAALITLSPGSSSRDVVRIEVAVADDSVGWQYLRYYVMAIETVLENYPGLVVSRYIVDTNDPNAKTNRHRLGSAIQMLEDAQWMGKDAADVQEKMPWLPLNMGWYVEKAWRQSGALQQLRTQELVHEAVRKVDVLKKLVVADGIQRKYPALWTLTYDADAKTIEVKMLSDLSGDCFHEPIVIAVPNSFFSTHGDLLKNGIAILSNVVPEVLSLGIVQKIITAVAPDIDGRVNRAEKIYNLIDKLDLTSNVSVQPSASQRLSPRGAVVLLRDLLTLHDSSFDELTLPDLAKLQCATTQDGHFVWASRQEIMALGDALTPCDPEDTKPIRRTFSSVSTESSNSSTAHTSIKLRLTVTGVEGLTPWDWRRVYCKWHLLDAASTLLAFGSTPPHMDASVAPSWTSIEFAASGVSSIESLRMCSLVARVKRPSRCLGVVKNLGDGRLVIGDQLPHVVHEACGLKVSLRGGQPQLAVRVLLFFSS